MYRHVNLSLVYQNYKTRWRMGSLGRVEVSILVARLYSSTKLLVPGGGGCLSSSSSSSASISAARSGSKVISFEGVCTTVGLSRDPTARCIMLDCCSVVLNLVSFVRPRGCCGPKFSSSGSSLRCTVLLPVSILPVSSATRALILITRDSIAVSC